jgi:hypothetical protein
MEQDVLSGRMTLSAVEKQVSPRSRREFTARVMDSHVRAKAIAKRNAIKKRIQSTRTALQRLNDEYRRQLIRTGALTFTKSKPAVKRLMKKLLPGVFETTLYDHKYPLFGIRQDEQGNFVYDFSSPISDQLFKELATENKLLKREMKAGEDSSGGEEEDD